MTTDYPPPNAEPVTPRICQVRPRMISRARKMSRSSRRPMSDKARPKPVSTSRALPASRPPK